MTTGSDSFPEVTLNFNFERETKGTVRYQEVDANGDEVRNPVVGTLYVQKDSIRGKAPNSLVVTIKVG